MKTTIQQQITNTTDIYVQADDGRIFRIWEGTGDNLFAEDIELGYVDYINYEIYQNIQAIYDQDYDDGGMILLKQLYADMSVADIIREVAEFESVSFKKGLQQND